jgi:Zn-finger nucleic acid-binding protein
MPRIKTFTLSAAEREGLFYLQGEIIMKCPSCQVELRMTDRQGVEIDYCPQCRGVWLDRGELDKIIERSEQRIDVSERPEPRYDEPRRDYDRDSYEYQKRRKKSFLGDIFDFD